MPTYEYACRACGEHLEAVQSFTDDPLETCPACGGELRKVFRSVGIVFKGSGFYKTDSRSTSSSGAPASSVPASEPSSGSSSEKSTTETSSAPAPTKDAPAKDTPSTPTVAAS
jgi:putative FmdB family regulatory protein